ncbi:MAG: WXG100 family type VII secretion target [Marmoricola sp.]
MTRYSVDLAELDSVIGDMQRFETRLSEQMGAVDAEIERLHLTWTGAAAAAQSDAHQKMMSGAREMHQALVRMREGARRAHSNYTAAGRTNAQMWAQTR